MNTFLDKNMIIDALDKNGIFILPSYVGEEKLKSMRQTYSLCLKHVSYNDSYGYHKYVCGLKIIEDLLLLNKEFLNLALDPMIVDVMSHLVGPDLRLKECRGWLTEKTWKLNPANGFTGWHIDGWYDKSVYSEAPPQYKVCLYLSDVTSGCFSYVVGSHKPSRAIPGVLHQHFTDDDVKDIGEAIQVNALAGSIVIFNTHGIHKQGTPVLDERIIAMYTYHDRMVKIDPSELKFSRYSPLKLNAGFISSKYELNDLKILGLLDPPLVNTTINVNHNPRFPRVTALVTRITTHVTFCNTWKNYFYNVFNRLIKKKWLG